MLAHHQRGDEKTLHGKRGSAHAPLDILPEVDLARNLGSAAASLFARRV